MGNTAPVPHRRVVAAGITGLVLAGCAASPSATPSATPSVSSSVARPGPSSGGSAGPTTSAAVLATLRLAGFTAVLDPGHQLGNARHPAQANRVVDAGNGIRKACNSTGTSTVGGYPESRVTMSVALAAFLTR